MSKDYYEILGATKDSTQEEIKKAFRKKAHQYHPDKAKGDEAKFKEVNEAYQVLGNEEKKKQYDQFGSTFDQQGGFGGGTNWEDFMKYARSGSANQNGGASYGFNFSDLGLDDIFADFFGMGRRSRGGAGRGQDIEAELEIDFQEAIDGIEKSVELYKTMTCDHCSGNQAEPGTPIVTCSTCQGNGQMQRIQNTILGQMRTASICHQCQGQGKTHETACKKCKGQGVMKGYRKLKVKIPAGIDNGQTIRIGNEGAAGKQGGLAGDLYLTVYVKPSRDFQREGDDIITKTEVDFPLAALGGELEIKTLDGEVKMKIPSGTESGKIFKLKDRGVPHLGGRGRGDQLIEVFVKTPKKLSRKAKKLLKELESEL